MQNRLADPLGAQKLLEKAIHHREKHGLESTLGNADVHIDIGRSLSKSNRYYDAEFHLCSALLIYRQIDAAPEHMGNLLLYRGFVAERQGKQDKAESLYREAIDIYRTGGVVGENADTALRSLSRSLRTQGILGDATLISPNVFSDTRTEEAPQDSTE